MGEIENTSGTRSMSRSCFRSPRVARPRAARLASLSARLPRVCVRSVASVAS